MTPNPQPLAEPFWRPPANRQHRRPRRFRQRRFGMTTDHERALGLVTLHRHLECPHYDACLDRAADSRWHGFTCLECPCPKT